MEDAATTFERQGSVYCGVLVYIDQKDKMNAHIARTWKQTSGQQNHHLLVTPTTKYREIHFKKSIMQSKCVNKPFGGANV